jgi:hypothetical protein
MTCLTDQELASCSPGDTFFFDIEVYPNFFLVMFMHEASGKTVVFWQSPGCTINRNKLRWVLNRFRIVSFNGLNFDIPLIRLAVERDVTCRELSLESTTIIKDDLRRFSFYKKHGLKEVDYNHIDLIEVAPLKASLKTYGARLGAKKIQDLPYDPLTDLTFDQMADVAEYCENDLLVTKLLWESLQDAIELREELGEQYGIDLRSKSNAQCAEAIFKRLTGAMPTGVRAGVLYFKPPSCIQFLDPALRSLLLDIQTQPFTVDDEGKITGPECISGKRRVTIAGKQYTVGIGGLHSNEKSVWYRSNENMQLFDYDVASYYPRAIDIQEIAPPAIGEQFLDLYRGLIRSRLQDKKDGLKRRANAKKIIINGIFGKLRNRYSVFYYPQGFVQVTLTGQLILLMLIEGLELSGIPVVSANTDGIVIACPADKVNLLKRVVSSWENVTGFEMEGNKYDAIYLRDVNSYIAIKDSETVKTKGAFSWQEEGSEESLSKNPKAAIVAKTVVAYLQCGMDIHDTIHDCNNLLDFCIVRHVNGGAEKDGVYLGKTVRFYYAADHDMGAIRYVKNGNMVPDSECTMPLMELPDDFDADLDYDRYIKEAHDALADLGVLPKPEKVRKTRAKRQPVDIITAPAVL